MVLAADYAESGRQEASNKLIGPSNELLRKLYFDAPVRTKPVSGWITGEGERVDGINFGKIAPVELRSLLDSKKSSLPTSVLVKLPAKTGVVALSVNTRFLCDDGDEVGAVELLSKGRVVRTIPIKYGWNVRSAEDKGVLFASSRSQSGACLLKLPITVGADSLRLSMRSNVAGLLLKGVTILDR
jgi:hypothetical protein